MGEVVDGTRRDPRIWGRAVMDLGSSVAVRLGLSVKDRGQGLGEHHSGV